MRERGPSRSSRRGCPADAGLDAIRGYRSARRGVALWAWPALLALPILIAGCSDHYDHHACYHCVSVTPEEVSYGVVSADLNADGAADVAALSRLHHASAANASNLKIYLASGGAYGAPTYVPTGRDPLFAAVADLNTDGLMDLVTASYDDGALDVFLNDQLSPGTLNPPLVLPSPGASQVAIGDVNADGLPDLISADFNVSLFLQTSPATFAAPIALYQGGANWVAVGDLNGDGALDVALTDSVGVKVLMHAGAAGAATFAAPVSMFTQTANLDVIGANLIGIADLDGDGLNDLVITDPGSTGELDPTVRVLRQNAAAPGSFLPAVAYPIATHDLSQSLRLVDLTGSGTPDIVIGGLQSVTVLLHDPASPGGFLTASAYAAPGADEVDVADVNGDGALDILVSNGVTQPLQSGVLTTHPGVLLQSATSAGTFGALQELP